MRKRREPIELKWLSDPLVADLLPDIRRFCAEAEEFDNTVSRRRARRIKDAFLSKLRKMLILMKHAENPAVERARIEELLKVRHKTLSELDATEAVNPDDWRMEKPRKNRDAPPKDKGSDYSEYSK